MTATDTHSAIDAVWRIESARIIAGLTRIVRDVGLAEELAQDALVAALEQWPQSGIPDNPGAWLMAAAKNRAIDLWRRNKRLELKHAELGRELQAQQEMAVPSFEAALDDVPAQPLKDIGMIGRWRYGREFQPIIITPAQLLQGIDAPLAAGFEVQIPNLAAHGLAPHEFLAT